MNDTNPDQDDINLAQELLIQYIDFIISFDSNLSWEFDTCSIDRSLTQAYVYAYLNASYQVGSEWHLIIYDLEEAISSIDSDLDLYYSDSKYYELRQLLQNLHNELPSNKDRKLRECWWRDNRIKWANNLRNIMISYRYLGHNWHFSQEDKELLHLYYYVNKLLVDCLMYAGCTSYNVRQTIEETLLSPIIFRQR